MLTRDSFSSLRQGAWNIIDWYKDDRAVQSVNSILVSELCDMSEQLYLALTEPMSEEERDHIMARYKEIFDGDS